MYEHRVSTLVSIKESIELALGLNDTTHFPGLWGLLTMLVGLGLWLKWVRASELVEMNEDKSLSGLP